MPADLLNSELIPDVVISSSLPSPTSKTAYPRPCKPYEALVHSVFNVSRAVDSDTRAYVTFLFEYFTAFGRDFSFCRPVHGRAGSRPPVVSPSKPVVSGDNDADSLRDGAPPSFLSPSSSSAAILVAAQLVFNVNSHAEHPST